MSSRTCCHGGQRTDAFILDACFLSKRREEKTTHTAQSRVRALAATSADVSVRGEFTVGVIAL